MGWQVASNLLAISADWTPLLDWIPAAAPWAPYIGRPECNATHVVSDIALPAVICDSAKRRPCDQCVLAADADLHSWGRTRVPSKGTRERSLGLLL